MICEALSNFRSNRYALGFCALIGWAALDLSPASHSVLMSSGVSNLAWAGEIVQESDLDGRRLKALGFALDEWREAAVVSRDRGMKCSVFFVPDAIAFKVTSTYLGFRKRGMTHARAITSLKGLLPRWKRFEQRSMIDLQLVNEKFASVGGKRRVFSTEKNLEKDALSVELDGKKRLPFELSGAPSGLRLAKLRVKKFWTTADGATRRTPRAKADPASIGRKPLISKPFESLVLESGVARMELLLRTKTIQERRGRAFTIKLHQWKRYDGPFVDDILDLNNQNPHELFRGVQATAILPPSGMTVPPSVSQLVKEVREQKAPKAK